MRQRVAKVIRRYEALGLDRELELCAILYRCLQLKNRALEIVEAGAEARK